MKKILGAGLAAIVVPITYIIAAVLVITAIFTAFYAEILWLGIGYAILAAFVFGAGIKFAHILAHLSNTSKIAHSHQHSQSRKRKHQSKRK